ncbi:DinB family protein [Paenibacillus flagellatus]|nr:DinB family protein [Paenibacillus flagellatus]
MKRNERDREGGKVEEAVERPALLLDVRGLSAARRWYEDVLGWSGSAGDESERQAVLRVPGGGFALLVEAGNEGAGFEGGATSRPKPGERFYVPVPDGPDGLDELRRRAEAAGAPVADETEPSCWRTLTIGTPEGYRAAYWQELDASDDTIVALFAAGPDALERSLAGLDDAALDWSLAPGKWSIRQQVLHTVDLELATMHKLKFALASDEPGRAYTASRFTQDAWAEGMCYSERPIAAEVALFRALRDHTLCVCRHIPGALARSVVSSGGRVETAARLLKAMAGHANTHIRRIREIRRLHGR